MRVFVCSPFRGEVERNVAFAKKAALHVAASGGYPFVPHLLYPQFLNDNLPAERVAGIEAGCEYLKVCDEIWVFTQYGVTTGMAYEIRLAFRHGLQVRWVHGFEEVE